MKGEDLVSILCKLKYFSDDFSTIQSTFFYEFSERKYEIKFEREHGNLVSFHLKDIGVVRNENN